MSNSRSVSIILKAEICQKGHHYSMFTAGQVTHASSLLPDPVISQLLPFVCIIVVMLHSLRNRTCPVLLKNDKQKMKAQKGGLTPYKQRSLRMCYKCKI